ncbi:hypothetical protein DH2020_027709 [Rehmannia glutinosa]|uniref:Glycosyltransferase n=1 Tax=Rehmannia glutinosa TaxID=99300 RepID=A0ABR0VTF0_REHGL
MEKEQPKFKILMFPWLAHGHIFPFLELAKRLSTRNFTIYLCSTPINLDSIKTSIDQKEYSSFDVKLVELHVPSLPQLPPEMHTTKNLPSNLLPTLLQAFQISTSSFSDILDSVKPDLLIYDLFQPWAPKIASSKGIPRVYFCTSGATPCSFYHHSYTVGTGSPFPYQAIYLRDHEKVNLRNLIAPYIKDADDDFAFGNFRLSSDIVLVKSCRDVEGKYIDYLSVLSKKRIVSTGPLVVDVNCDDKESWEMMEWLNGKKQCSTVYISFGSECFLSKEQIAEIAKGLKLSKANFLWVLRFPIGEKTSLEEELPAGFLETVKNRGIVISRWAPQNKILAHPSIGGFVSHCGWSSITESMYFGVPIIAMPMKFEQPINARLVVEAGVAVEVEKDVNGRFVGEDVAKAINKVTVEKEFCEVLRDRAKRLSEKIKENAEQEMNETAEQLLRICLKN